MRKLLLTSAGFDNKKIEEKFLELVSVERAEIKVLFIPTAAISHGARSMVKECKKELINAGVLEENITTFDLDREISFEEIKDFNAIYFCGGSSEYLLNEINRTNFNNIINKFVHNGGLYMGVSAGSIIATKNLQDNLGYVNCNLNVHCAEGTQSGELNTENCPNVDITDNQAILVLGDNISIIE